MIRLNIKLQCVSEVSKLKKFQRLSMIPRYNKFTKVRIRVPSKSRIHVESESSINEDNIFAISPAIVKGTSWNLLDLTSHRQGVFDKKRKKLNSSSVRQKLANSDQKNLCEIPSLQPDATKNLKKKLDLT